MSTLRLIPLGLIGALAAAGCDRSGAVPAGSTKGSVLVVASPFLAKCEQDLGRSGLMSRLIDKALGHEYGEVVWGTRNLGSGHSSGGSASGGRETERDFGGMFIFEK